MHHKKFYIELSAMAAMYECVLAGWVGAERADLGGCPLPMGLQDGR